MKTKYLKLFLAVCLCGFVALVVFSVSVLAIADPDSPPQISAVYVYEDLLEDDDIGVLVDYYLDYSVNATPDETATEAYMAVFVDVDGVTQLKSVAPYTFVGSGYGRGLIWIYFSADEVATHSIDSANETFYDVWLVGNPTLAWTGVPPKTVVGIDEWQTTGDSAVLLALRVLYYADVLELIWALDMIEVTALGNRLTAAGESYFENVIPNLRVMAPAAFAAGEFLPVMEDLDYSTAFGATMTDGTGTVTGSTITFINSYTGTADAGSTNIRIRDAELTQEDDYWNGASLSILATGETAIVTDFIAATDELQFAALSAAVGIGDAYTVAGTRYAGVAGAGSTRTSLIDAALTQADDYWNGATLVIVTTTDGLSPEGETARVTDFIAATDELQFATLSATVDAGDTYTVTGSRSSHIVTVTAIGTFVLELNNGTVGTITDGIAGTLDVSPVDLVAGTNTITVTGAGDLIVVVYLQDTQARITDTIIGTGLDLTEVATRFGMSREMFSGLVWLVVSIIICAATYRVGEREGVPGGSKVVMIVFDLCIVGGAVLGLLPILVAALMFIGFGAFTGYILFFRTANI